MQKIVILFFLAFALCQKALFASTSNYETYLESWDSGWNTAMTGMPATPSGADTTYNHVTLDIAFASYTFPGLNGLQFSDESADTNTVISYVHSQNGLVKISYGGASYAGPNYFISQTAGWPDNIPDLVAGVSSVVTGYGFDGVDFDIEDALPSGTTAQQFADQLFSFLTQMRAALPNKIITLTIPGQGWGTYWLYLAQSVAAATGTVNAINFMEYDIWVGTSTYAEQIEADLITYTSPTNTAPAPNYATGWGIPPSLIQLGLMPGNDDTGQFLSVSDSGDLTQSAINMGLFGVMTWDLDRDAGTDPVPSLDGATPYAYTNEIRGVLNTGSTVASHSPFSAFSFYRTSDQRSRVLARQFQRQNAPLHGAPP